MNSFKKELKLNWVEAKRESILSTPKENLTASERIDVLLDEDSFEEFDMFVTHRTKSFGLDKQNFFLMA